MGGHHRRASAADARRGARALPRHRSRLRLSVFAQWRGDDGDADGESEDYRVGVARLRCLSFASLPCICRVKRRKLLHSVECKATRDCPSTEIDSCFIFRTPTLLYTRTPLPLISISRTSCDKP